ncbi:MAG: alkaline phosphatase D family protein [Bacteroidota bacterium]
MNSPLFLLLTATLLLCNLHLHAQQSAAEPNQQVIAFGSCNKPEIDGKMWPAIAANDPDLFIWLGDIIYGDTQDMRLLRSKYKEQSRQPDYKKFAKKTPVVGVWDDHDYGINDGGKFFAKKAESKEELLRFLGVSKEDEVRQHEGVYSASVMGTPNRLVKIILLDGRSFRDTVVHSSQEGRRYEANPDGDILGEAQWEWLEKELTNSPAAVHIIGCGIQFIAAQHGWEKWANFPKSRKRLFDLLAKTSPANPVLISGDRHIAEISSLPIEGWEKPIYDITASGLTHTWSKGGTEVNKHRVGDLIVRRNFGIVQITWDENNQPTINLEVRGLNNELFLQNEI